MHFYRPQRSCGQGNIFTPVCHSFCSQGGGGLSQCMLGYQPPRSRPPSWSRHTPPSPGKQTPAYGQRAAGTHPTGMHSCHSLIFVIARMHSSRMRTACFSGCLGVGCLPGDVCIGGMFARDTHPPARCMLEYTSVLPIACWDNPHPREQNDRCKNITFPQLRLQAVTSSKALDEHNKEIVRNTPNENNFGFERL